MRQYGRDHFQSEVDHYFALNSLIPTAVKPALFNPDVWQSAAEDQPMLDYYRDQFATRESEPTSVKLKRILHKTNLEALLSRLDSATMQASLEARVPYTDHRIVEKMFRAPMNFKIDVDDSEQAPYLASGDLQQRDSLRSKRVLRSVAEQLMPVELAQRKKASFPTPVQQWMGNEWSDWAARTLSESPFAHAVFQPAALAELTENPGQSGMWLWPILNIACWGDRAFAA
jgi:asparagine synthase (glutamine-hydrolysing)